MAAILVKRFNGISDSRILSYSGQILLNVMEAEFTDQQESQVLEMHGFDKHLIPEVLKLGAKMNQRLAQFQLGIQNSLYTVQVNKRNEEIAENQIDDSEVKENDQNQEGEEKMDLETETEP